jgi:hypothetical protein
MSYSDSESDGENNVWVMNVFEMTRKCLTTVSLIMTEARRRKMIRIRPFLAGPTKTADEIRNDVDKIISKR